MLCAESSRSSESEVTARFDPEAVGGVAMHAMHDLPLHKLSDGAILTASVGYPAKPAKKRREPNGTQGG